MPCVIHKNCKAIIRCSDLQSKIGKPAIKKPLHAAAGSGQESEPNGQAAGEQWRERKEKRGYRAVVG